MKKNNKNKIVSLETKKIRKEEHNERVIAQRMKRLKKAGITDEQIDELIKDENTRTIMCLYYGNHTVDLGEKEVEVKVFDKKTKKYNTVKRKQNVVLRGRAAAEHYIREKEYDVVVFEKTFCCIKTTADKAEEIAKDLRENIGRCSITKPKKLTVEEVKEKYHPKPEKKEQPTHNTNEAKKAAKARRKKSNIAKTSMRPYYAAWRKGGVSERIKKHNKELAKKIEKWIKKRKAIEEAKHEKAVAKDNRQLTSIERKCNKRARKVAKHLAKIERRKEAEAKRMKNNAAKAKKTAQKQNKATQTELKMAA